MAQTTLKERRTFLGMPGYGEITAGAAKGFWRATANPDGCEFKYYEGSLLANCFNRLWADALNIRHAGRRLDYFAMQHSDIEPEDGWLDALIEELEDRDLDVLGVVAPIKSPEGLTSIALHDPGDNWKVFTRLTMREVYRLPQTFTSDDVGGPLLLNTGLWVCRFDPEWARKVRFTINDRIVFNTAEDCYMAQVEPEDWYFSRLCHELGLKIGCTRKIALGHRGPAVYLNNHPWGQHFDKHYCRESVLPPQSHVQFPWDVRGWLTEDEGLALADLAAGRDVLEVGSYLGRSTICMAQRASRVVSVDPHDGRATPTPTNTYHQFLANLERYGVRDKVEACRGAFGAQQLDRQSFDLAFIDGDHAYEAVLADCEKAMDCLRPGGLLALHDYRTHAGQHDGRWDPGVTKAVDELLARGGKLIATHATVAVIEPPVAVLQES